MKTEQEIIAESMARMTPKQQARIIDATVGHVIKEPLRIERAYTRQYTDNGQVTAYVEWDDGTRTEGKAQLDETYGAIPTESHLQALFARARREGNTPFHEVW